MDYPQYEFLESGLAFMDSFEQAVVKSPKSVAYRFRDTLTTLTSGSLRALVELLMQIALDLNLSMMCAAFWAFALLLPACRYLSPFQSLLCLAWNA